MVRKFHIWRDFDNEFLHSWCYYTEYGIWGACLEAAFSSWNHRNFTVPLCVMLMWILLEIWFYLSIQEKRIVAYKDKSLLRQTLASQYHTWEILISAALFSFGEQTRLLCCLCQTIWGILEQNKYPQGLWKDQRYCDWDLRLQFPRSSILEAQMNII